MVEGAQMGGGGSFGSSSRPSLARPVPAAAQQRPAASRSSPELVGRREELGLLEDELSRATASELRAVLLVGEAGVGKSRLARELLARHRDIIGLLARAHPLAATAAFGLWTEAVDPFLQALSDSEVVELCGGLVDDLASLFPRVAAVRGGVPERDPPLPRVLQGLTHLLRNLSRRAPLVVLLDDVHFADASSWESLRYFARHLDDAPLLVVATSRAADLANHDLAAQVLFELDEDGLLTRLEVAPLARREIKELSEAVIDAPAPAALVDWIVERSQGNPLYAIGLLRALMTEQADLSAPHLRRLPEGLTERVTSELRRFDTGPRAILELLAVVARPVSFSELTALTGEPLEELQSTLDRLVGAGIVVEEERGRELSYELQHPLVRDVIYQATSGARRRVLHRRAGRSLLASGHLAEAALHFARSAERGDSEAVEVLLDAMRQAERREAFREALDLQAELVGLLPVDDARWLEVLEAMYVRAEWLIDHRAETHAPTAVRALWAIDGLLQDSPDHAHRATVKFRLANFLAWGMGELEAAQEACWQAHELFVLAGDQRQALLAAREVAWIKGLRGDLAGMAADAERVVEAADADGDRFVAMQGLAAVGYSSMFTGTFGRGESAYRRAAEIAHADEKPYRLTVVLGTLAGVLAFQGRTAEATELIEQAKASSPAYRDSIMIEIECTVAWLAGDFTSALAAALEEAAWAPVTSRRRSFGMTVGAIAAVEAGDVLVAERLLARAQSALAGRDWSFFLQYAHYAESMLAWHQGDPAECVARLRPAIERMLEMEVRPWAAFALFDLAEAAADARDAVAASGAADRLGALAEVMNVPLYRGMAVAGSAWARLANGGEGEAVEPARQATELLARTGCRAYEARARYLLARCLSAAQRPAAVSELERAAAMFERGGGVWRRGSALELLRRLGSAGRRAAAAALGPSALTRREREVARLAARGMSAREIAQTLFIGERTVESHLASVYAKLGVESKLQLVSRAPELGLS
jgi:ATP/maltotriose-dependent transcriptional regulator MalT